MSFSMGLFVKIQITLYDKVAVAQLQGELFVDN